MEVTLHPKAAKVLNRLREPNRSRILKALDKLENDPPDGDIKALTGRNGYRLRIGNYRLLFDKIDNKIIVFDIDQRGQIYKGGK